MGKSKKNHDVKRGVIALGVLSFGLLGLYIWQVTFVSTAGFEMRDLQEEIASLEEDQYRLDRRISELRSASSVARRMQMLGLVEPDQIVYMSGSDAVAVNR
jgi:hypothetical protein